MLPAFSKPVRSSEDDIPQSARKQTLNPKLTSEDNVHIRKTAFSFLLLSELWHNFQYPIFPWNDKLSFYYFEITNEKKLKQT